MKKLEDFEISIFIKSRCKTWPPYSAINHPLFTLSTMGNIKQFKILKTIIKEIIYYKNIAIQNNKKIK